jgi:hypothetical protein
MYLVMARPSYRSSLASYLFGITPTSPQNTEARISDLCREISLKQIKEMRQTPKLASSSNMSAWNRATTFNIDCSTHPFSINSEYTHMEDTAYWFGIVCDISRSIFNCTSTVLLTGQIGETRVWPLVRQQVHDFDLRNRHLHHSMMPLSDVAVLTILQYGSACKTMF